MTKTRFSSQTGQRNILCLFVGFVAAVSSVPVVCAVTGNTRIPVTVNVHAEPCVINGGKPVSVDFGDEVMITRIDVTHYRKPVNYLLSCLGQSSADLRLQIQGTPGFDGKVLKTNKAGLGVAFFHHDQQLNINAWLPFSWPNRPALEAVLVKMLQQRWTQENLKQRRS